MSTIELQAHLLCPRCGLFCIRSRVCIFQNTQKCTISSSKITDNRFVVLQARAPMAHVVIVATHCDQLPKNIRKKELDRIQDTILKLYTKKAKVYPTMHGVEFVSCYEGKKDFSDIIKLANVLYYVAHKVETISSNLFYAQTSSTCHHISE